MSPLAFNARTKIKFCLSRFASRLVAFALTAITVVASPAWEGPSVTSASATNAGPLAGNYATVASHAFLPFVTMNYRPPFFDAQNPVQLDDSTFGAGYVSLAASTDPSATVPNDVYFDNFAMAFNATNTVTPTSRPRVINAPAGSHHRSN